MRTVSRLDWFKSAMRTNSVSRVLLQRSRLRLRPHSAGLSYVIANLGVAAAVIANLLLETYLQASPTLFLFLCAIIFATWLGGLGPGLAATALSVLAFDFFFLPPNYYFKFMLQDIPRLALFAIAGVFVVGLITAQRTTAESLRRSRADLLLGGRNRGRAPSEPSRLHQCAAGAPTPPLRAEGPE